MPRKYSPLPEQEILELIRQGRIVVNALTGDVYSAGRGCLQKLVPDPCDHGYLHVRIYSKGRRRSCAVHRLVVMSVTGKLIPASCEVVHDDTDRQHNWFTNLIVKDISTHRSESVRRRWNMRPNPDSEPFNVVTSDEADPWEIEDGRGTQSRLTNRISGTRTFETERCMALI